MQYNIIIQIKLGVTDFCADRYNIFFFFNERNTAKFLINEYFIQLN